MNGGWNLKIQIIVSGEHAWCENRPKKLTAGTHGLKCEFVFLDESWDLLIKNAVIEGSSITKVVLNVDGEFVVPWECMEDPHTLLKIGVEGRIGDGSIVYPTVFAPIAELSEGVDDSATESDPPTPTQFEQLQIEIDAKADADDLEELTETVATIDHDLGEAITAINGKANAAHSHSISDVEDLENILDSFGDSIGDLETGKQDKLIAGSNITINGNVISATGGGSGGSVNWDDIQNKPATFTPSAHEHTVSEITDFPSIPTDTLELTNGAGYIKADDVPVTDVKINGTSVLSGGVASIPVNANYGLGYGVVGLYIGNPAEIYITQRKANNALTLNRLDFGVKSAMCDGIGADWTETEQAAARARLGIPHGWKLIADYTLSEDTRKVSFTTYADGTAFDGMTHIEVIGDNVTADSQRSLNLAFNDELEESGYKWNLCCGNVNTTTGFCRITAELIGSKWFGYYNASSTSRSGGFQRTVYPAAEALTAANNPVTSKLTIGLGWGNLKANSHFEIWGK